MNTHSKFTRLAAIFKSNRSQAVRIPKDLAFPDDLRSVIIRKVGKSIYLTPRDALWEDYFAEPGVADFPERAAQGEYEDRESL